ncbi:MAG: hypothetical protein R2816_12440 [Flavobacteriaceae bacterium]|nr:hypothetical protein [Flavobacteriaceae bacterium]
MFKTYTYKSLALIFALVLIASCTKDDGYTDIEAPKISPVTLDLSTVPYETLSEYNFFEGNMADLNPVYGVLPYKIISSLFIDYANAKTFVWMPKDSTAIYVNDYSVLDFPTGSVLITTHYFENVLPNNSSKMIETRLLIKKESEWIMANYKWNEQQTEATYTTEGSFVNVDLLHDNTEKNVTYKIPNYSECFTCHNKSDVIEPIGTKPQNLNSKLMFNDGLKNQLKKWVEFGYLEDNLPANIVSVVDWQDESQPLDLRVRSYFDINCAHCHSNDGYCNYASMRFEFNKTADISNLGVCVESVFYINPTISHVVKPGVLERSALYFRMNSTEDQYKMPIIGRVQKHDEGLTLIEEWINSLSTDCN